MERPTLRRVAPRAVLALLACQLLVGSRAAAAPGDAIADVTIAEPYPEIVAPSVAFDGRYLYHTGYGGSVLHRIDVPPAHVPSAASGQVDVPITGAPSGIMTLTYDAGRAAFWAVGGDGVSIYLLTPTGAATLVFAVDPDSDRPGFEPGGPVSATEIKVAYDRVDDTIWYSPDATSRIYHYHTFADATGTAALVAATPYVDLNVPPNDMTPECGYSQSSGVTVGGAHLFVTVSGCPFYFEYTKTGTKVAAYAYHSYDGPSTQDLECDDVSYAVPVFWIRDGYDGHIRAFEQPAADACVFGGGPDPTPVPTPVPTPAPTPTPLLPPLPIPSLPLPTLPPLL